MDFRTVAVYSVHSGKWHMAQQNMATDNLLTSEACNLDDAERLELYPELPEWVKAKDLCKRCHWSPDMGEGVRDE